MTNEKRLIEIPADGIIRIPIMEGENTVGERCIDLSNLPTVAAVEVVHGRWILQEDGYHCSNCDIQAIYTGVKLNYCPNCGAKMDGDGNEID